MIDPPPRPRSPAPAGPDADGVAHRPGDAYGKAAGGRQPAVFGLDFQGRIGQAAYLKAACCIFIVAGVPASLTLRAERWNWADDGAGAGR